MGLTMSQTAMLRSLLQVTIMPLQNLNLKLNISGQVAARRGEKREGQGGVPAGGGGGEQGGADRAGNHTLSLGLASLRTAVKWHQCCGFGSLNPDPIF